MSINEQWFNSDSSINTNPSTSIKTCSKNKLDPYINNNAYTNTNIYTNNNTNTVELGSPITCRNLKHCLSFASIKQHKALHQLQTPKNSIKKSKLKQKQKQNNNLFSDRQTLTGIKQKPKRILTKREQQSQKIVLQSYKLQSQSLKQTVTILKQQIRALTSNNKIIKQQNTQLQQQKNKQQQKIMDLQKQLQKTKNKLYEYENIMPKIEELELLQDGMIQENARIKNREAVLRELLAQIVVFVGGKQDQTAVFVRNVIGYRLDKTN